MSLFLPIDIRYHLRNRILKERLDCLIPSIMQESDIDMWIIAAKECNEDPVMFSMLPAPMMSARRTTILIFVKTKDGSVERLCMGRKNAGLDHFYRDVWLNQKDSNWEFDAILMPDRDRNGDQNEQNVPETQMECLARVIREYDPQKIGLNVSHNTAFADGLSHSIYQEILQAVDDRYRERLTSAESLCIRWLETRTESELDFYRRLVKKAHSIIAEGLSNAVIVPGKTTNKELGFWLMEEAERCGFFNWFNAVITIRRNGRNIGKKEPILPGDLVHIDVGYECMGYYCDSQANAYVLKEDENEPPTELRRMYKKCRQAHQILESCFKEGLSGDEILKAGREKIQAELPDLRPFIYVHPIGIHGHAAGPNIGRTDNQKFVREMGWYRLHENTMFAMEMCLIGKMDIWPEGNAVIGLETETVFQGGHIKEIDPQNDLYIVYTL